jgi:hypothetical protein
MFTTNDAMQDQSAELEQYFVLEYLKSKGHTMESARLLPPEAFKLLMTEASTYASVKIAEVQDTAEIVKKIHAH